MIVSERIGVFETNSSSLHSISIGNSNYNENIFNGEDVTISVKNYEKGPEILNKPEQRASYLLACVNSQSYNGENLKEWEDKIVERFKNSGAKDVNIIGSGSLYSDYLAEKLLQDLKEDNIYLDDFLFGNTTILIDGDCEAELSSDASELGMDYDKEYKELKRSQYRII